LLLARPESHRPVDFADRADSLLDRDVRAALLAGSVLVLDNECKDSPNTPGDDNRSAAEPGKSARLSGSLAISHSRKDIF
jgi:hypothetical protein